MSFPSDLEIAGGAALKPLEEIADAMGIASHLLEPHGEEVMKIKLEAIAELAGQPAARYVVVSAITPTPLGEGKTTTTVGLGQGFKHIGKRATVAIRQPSMGPTFGIKGGAAGGGSMAVLLRDAIKPNLLQTLENTPVLVHAGPFGNIATGNSSVIADLIGIHAGDYLVTEAGFGADMGAERFFNIKCRTSGLRPGAAVVVATVRALKAHSGKYRIVAGKALPPELLMENPDDVELGAANLKKQLENIRIHGVSPVVAINSFPTDHPSEHQAIREIAAELGARAAVCTHFAQGGPGALGLAEGVNAA